MNYRKMIVWQKAMQLTEAAYMEIRKLPQEELYALSAQMRRAVISIPSNIAEGAGRNSNNDLRYFMTVARGSATELETQFMVAEMLGYLDHEDIEPLMNMLDEIRRMLSALIKNGRVD
ncbi:four helix bundle protein [Dialister sp.]|jgi:four helix bundle protein|uniref:four helix bundle protein n=1 Tax=Dialister sp. TaxID=1955814 RepID=UPI0025D2C066|nr:four helix bundle protein [Dialister sp.]